MLLTLEAARAPRPAPSAGAATRAPCRSPSDGCRTRRRRAPARRGVHLCRRRRPRMRHAGAGRRPRRLFGRVPRRRPRHESRAGRALRHAGRRLPERRLHSIQGAAARGGRDGRGEPLRSAGRELRQADDRPGQAARAQGQGGGQAHRRPDGHGQDAQGHRGARRRRVPRPATTCRSRKPAAPGRRRPARSRPSSSATASSPPARRPCSCRSCRRTRASWTPPARWNWPAVPEAHADPGRRHHRPGNGHRVLDAGRAPGRGRDAGRPDAGRRPRPGAGLAEDERAALRQHHAQDQDRRRRGDQGRHPGAASKASRRPRSRSCTTWCCRPWAAARTAGRSAPTRPASR